MKTYTINELQEIESIIAQCKVCYIAMNGEDGYPYTIPMNFAYQNRTFYFHSGPEGKKTELLKINNKVCISLYVGEELIYQHAAVACSYSMISKSVMCRGKVGYVESFDEKIACLNLIMKQYSNRSFEYGKPAVENVKIWKVEAEDMVCKSFGNSQKKR